MCTFANSSFLPFFMSTLVYDFAIVGAGAAGIHLALAMEQDPWFSDKKILILDKDEKKENDRTWCFWEKGTGRWDSIVTHSWHNGKFITNSHDLDLKLPPYKYKMLHALSFYQHAKVVIESARNFDWITEDVKKVTKKDDVELMTAQNTYKAKQVFDSRIDPAFYEEKDGYIRLLQHFKGWFLKTQEPVFDPDTFVMMDYRIKLKDTTSFIYVLPTSETEALIEFTFFSPDMVEDAVYDRHLEKYIHEILQLRNYSVERVEQGIIPMSNYPFHNSNQGGILKIGTAGSWVKPSTGYSFKNAEKMAGKIVRNLKKGESICKDLFQKKYNFYDTLFLDVLHEHNELGEELFTSMYRRNSIQNVFRFLDEETSLTQDISILTSVRWFPFFRAIKNQYL